MLVSSTNLEAPCALQSCGAALLGEDFVHPENRGWWVVVAEGQVPEAHIGPQPPLVAGTHKGPHGLESEGLVQGDACLLYTSDAADE